MNFDKEKFSKILIKIKDNYGSINRMAEKTDVTAAYISKLIRLMYNNAPSPVILKKIADNSNGVTTYEELMTICGHIKENDLDSYLLGMLGLTEQDMRNFSNSLNNIGLNNDELKIYENIITDMRKAIRDNDETFELDIQKYIKNESNEAELKIMKALDLYMKYLAKMNDFTNSSNQEKSIIINNNKTSKIPVLGIVKAGYNYLADENVIGYVTVNDSLNTNEFFALEVKGNSMEPLIYEKDIAIVKKQNDFENGDIVVALINGDEATIKRAYKTDDGLILQAINSSIQPLAFNKNDIETMPVRISGIVYNITRKFK